MQSDEIEQGGDTNWIRISRIENAIDNLDMTVYFLKTFSGIRKWKWAVIALHQTLYSFFIVALVNCGQKVVQGKHLIPIIKAAKELGKPKNLTMWDDSKSLIMQGETATAFAALVGMLRNSFEHFNTDHWSIEISMIENIFEEMLPVIRFMSFESNTILFTEKQEKAVKELLSNLEELV